MRSTIDGSVSTPRATPVVRSLLRDLLSRGATIEVPFRTTRLTIFTNDQHQPCVGVANHAAPFTDYDHAIDAFLERTLPGGGEITASGRTHFRLSPRDRRALTTASRRQQQPEFWLARQA